MGASSGVTAAQADPTANNLAQSNLQDYSNAASNSGIQGILSQYANGKMSLSDAQNAISGMGGATAQGGLSQLYSNPETASQVAQGQVTSNPVYSGLFGSSGLQGQAENNYGTATNNLASDRQALSGNDPSYGLQASDLAAYGTAADNIGRQTAQQNQGIAQSLAARGLGGTNSGAAIGDYAGSYGNQMEQLAGLQQQISQNRINTAMNLANARNQSDLAQQSANGNLATSLGNLGNSAYQGQLGANNNMANNQFNQYQSAANNALNNQIGQQNINNSLFSQQQQTKNPGIGGALLSGLESGVANVGSGAVSKGGQAAMGSTIG